MRLECARSSVMRSSSAKRGSAPNKGACGAPEGARRVSQKDARTPNGLRLAARHPLILEEGPEARPEGRGERTEQNPGASCVAAPLTRALLFRGADTTFQASRGGRASPEKGHDAAFGNRDCDEIRRISARYACARPPAPPYPPLSSGGLGLGRGGRSGDGKTNPRKFKRLSSHVRLRPKV